MVAPILNPPRPMVPSGPPAGGQVEQAAQQFEALLLSQMLRSAREAGGAGGWLGSEDGVSAPLLEMAEQQVAALLASAGGLGLAALVVSGLSEGDDNVATGASR